MKVGHISLEDISIAAKQSNEIVENFVKKEKELIAKGE